MPLSVQVASRAQLVPAGGGKRELRATAQRDDERSSSRAPADGIPDPTTARERPARVYRGLLVGVSGPRGVDPPGLAAHWPDGKGRFCLVLPARVRGRMLHLWESDFVTFSRTPAAPGSAVDLSAWPAALPVHVPRNVGLLSVKR